MSGRSYASFGTKVNPGAVNDNIAILNGNIMDAVNPLSHMMLNFDITFREFNRCVFEDLKMYRSLGILGVPHWLE